MARNTSAAMQSARYDAIKRSVSTIMMVEKGSSDLFVFADVDGVNKGDPPDLKYNVVAGEPVHRTDYFITRIKPPTGVSLQAPKGEATVWSFTALPDSDFNGAVFDADGSVRDVGAFRFGDARGNFIEVRVEPAATARIRVRKWDPADKDWYEQGEGDKVWEWQ